MNLKDEILKEHSKKQTRWIADYIGADEKRFAELVELFLHSEYRVAQRAAWIVSESALRYPFLINGHLPKMLKKLRESNIHNALKRNVIRILEDIEIPEECLDDITDLCFGYLTDSTEAIAIKAFSITVLCKVINKIPELKGELYYIIEDLMMKYQNESPAIMTRGKKAIKLLKNQRPF